MNFKLNSKRSTSELIFIFLFLGCGLLIAQQNETVYSEAVIPGTEVREFYSSANDQEYKLLISLPGGYEESTESYPVIYLLDAQWDFPLVYAIYGEQYYDGFLPGLILVGITWGGENPNPDDLRYRDFTPTDINTNRPSGNAEKFIEFIGNELMPFVEMNYRASSTDKTLMGSSLGGLFTLYTLFNHNKLFSRYVLTSPAIGWDKGITFDYAKDFMNNTELNAKLYMAIGEYENVNEFKTFAALLESTDYKGFTMQTRILEGMGHSGGKAEGYTRGLQFVFKKPELNSDPLALEDYVGQYEMSPYDKISLIVKNDYLYIVFQNNYMIKLFQESQDRFFVKGMFDHAEFHRNDAGEITGFQYYRFGDEGFIKKVR